MANPRVSREARMMGLEPRGEPLWGRSGVTGASKRAMQPHLSFCHSSNYSSKLADCKTFQTRFATCLEIRSCGIAIAVDWSGFRSLPAWREEAPGGLKEWLRPSGCERRWFPTVTLFLDA